MTRHLISCLAIVRQIRAAYDTGAGASDPKTNKQVVYSVQLAGSVRTYTFNTFGKLEELKFSYHYFLSNPVLLLFSPKNSSFSGI